MIHAFVKLPEGTAEKLSTLDALADRALVDGATVWVDLESFDGTELRRVGDIFRLDAEALEDCVTGEQRPRIDEFEDHLFLVTYGLPIGQAESEFETGKLAVFVGSRFLITVHDRALRTIQDVRAWCDRHMQQFLGRGVDFVLYTIIDGMVDRLMGLVGSFEDQIDDLEELSLGDRVEASLLSDVSGLRQQIVQLRRLTTAQRDLVAPLARGEYEEIAQGLEQRFRHVRDHCTRAIEMIDTLRDRLNGIRENYHSAIAARLNDIMKTLTLFATILLPLSLIAAIYGMNLPLWPPEKEPTSFWFVLGMMFVVGAGLFAYFRRKKWV